MQFENLIRQLEDRCEDRIKNQVQESQRKIRRMYCQDSQFAWAREMEFSSQLQHLEQRRKRRKRRVKYERRLARTEAERQFEELSNLNSAVLRRMQEEHSNAFIKLEETGQTLLKEMASTHERAGWARERESNNIHSNEMLAIVEKHLSATRYLTLTHSESMKLIQDQLARDTACLETANLEVTRERDEIRTWDAKISKDLDQSFMSAASFDTIPTAILNEAYAETAWRREIEMDRQLSILGSQHLRTLRNLHNATVEGEDDSTIESISSSKVPSVCF